MGAVGKNIENRLAREIRGRADIARILADLNATAFVFSGDDAHGVCGNWNFGHWLLERDYILMTKIPITNCRLQYLHTHLLHLTPGQASQLKWAVGKTQQAA